MGFPAPQGELMKHTDAVRLEPNTGLDLMHVTCAPPQVFGGPATVNGILAEVNWLHRQLLSHDPQLRFLGDLGEVTRARQTEPGTSIVLGIQDPPTADFGRTDFELDRLRMWGIVFSALAYDTVNRYGGGCLAPDVPLTSDGKRYIRELQE